MQRAMTRTAVWLTKPARESMLRWNIDRRSYPYQMELNIAVTNLVPLIGLLEESEKSVQPGSVGVVIEAADPAVVIVDFDGVLVSAPVKSLLPLLRRGLPIRKYRLNDLLMQRPNVGEDENLDRSS